MSHPNPWQTLSERIKILEESVSVLEGRLDHIEGKNDILSENILELQRAKPKARTLSNNHPTLWEVMLVYSAMENLDPGGDIEENLISIRFIGVMLDMFERYTLENIKNGLFAYQKINDKKRGNKIG